MKKLIFSFLLLFPLLSFAQSENDIRMKAEVDALLLEGTEQVVVNADNYDLSNRPESQITGYEKDGFFYKVVVTFKEVPHLLEMYYSPSKKVDEYGSVIYCRKVDLEADTLLSEIYFSLEFFRSEAARNRTYEDYKLQWFVPLANYPLILHNKKNGGKSNRFQFKAQLLAAGPDQMDCGSDHNYYDFKFKVIQSNPLNLIDEEIVIIESCPGFRGEGFFEIGATYEIEANINKMNSHGYVFIIGPTFHEEKLKTFWSSDIVRVDTAKK